MVQGQKEALIDWDGLVELSNRSSGGAPSTGSGMRGGGLRMGGRGCRMTGKRLRMKVLVDEDRLED